MDRVDDELASCAHRHVGTRRDERRKQNEARLREFEVGFEGAVHLSDLR